MMLGCSGSGLCEALNQPEHRCHALVWRRKFSRVQNNLINRFSEVTTFGWRWRWRGDHSTHHRADKTTSNIITWFSTRLERNIEFKKQLISFNYALYYARMFSSTLLFTESFLLDKRNFINSYSLRWLKLQGLLKKWLRICASLMSEPQTSAVDQLRAAQTHASATLIAIA